MLVADIHAFLDDRFSFEHAAAWDPVGLQLGEPGADSGRIAVCHEVTDGVVERCVEMGIATLVSYHPLLFEPTTAVIAGPTAAGRALQLLRRGVSLIVVHTAMDVAPRGTGDLLLEALGVSAAGFFAETEDGSGYWIGRHGSLDGATTAQSFALTVSERLETSVRVSGDLNKTIRSVCVLPGSGSSSTSEAADIADVLVTGDVGHHSAQAAVQLGLVVIDAGHIQTERPGVNHLYDSVRALAPKALFIASDSHPWEDVFWKT
ncbi:MAG: hypothetical protein BMS9Abin12_1506 [Acidimicrobiia bacterium]|nr:MAG: hypothetical protein BMS9Abin12_1506 [Acidimicrobiia bacterium]